MVFIEKFPMSKYLGFYGIFTGGKLGIRSFEENNPGSYISIAIIEEMSNDQIPEFFRVGQKIG